jgi:TPR repeat protein
VKAAQLLIFVLFAGLIKVAVAQAPDVDPPVLAKASAGDAAAEVSVGESYAKAAGAAQDPDISAENWNKAADWYIKGAAQSNVAAEIHLGECYSYGHGVARDKVKAAEWYRKAAEQGDPVAQGTLAMLYTLGQGVPQDDAEAYFWFDLAASAGTQNHERYITNRQNVGTRITSDQLAAVEQRLKKWKAAHPRPEAAK